LQEKNNILQKSSSETQLKVKRLWRTPHPSHPQVSDTARLTCWLAAADGGLLFPPAVVLLSPVPPTPGATCAAQPLQWQEPY